MVTKLLISVNKLLGENIHPIPIIILDCQAVSLLQRLGVGWPSVKPAVAVPMLVGQSYCR